MLYVRMPVSSCDIARNIVFKCKSTGINMAVAFKYNAIVVEYKWLSTG